MCDAVQLLADRLGLPAELVRRAPARWAWWALCHLRRRRDMPAIRRAAGAVLAARPQPSAKALQLDRSIPECFDRLFLAHTSSRSGSSVGTPAGRTPGTPAGSVGTPGTSRSVSSRIADEHLSPGLRRAARAYLSRPPRFDRPPRRVPNEQGRERTLFDLEGPVMP